MNKLALLSCLIVILVCSIGCTESDPAYVNIKDVTVNDGSVPTVPYYYQILDGQIPNHTPWFRLGYNGNIGTTYETMWDASTKYTWPTAAGQMEIISTSANDAAGNTGIQSVIITYLDGNHVEHQEILATNGLTAVPTVAVNMFRINYFAAYTVGTNGSSVGAISLRGVGGGTTYAYIPAIGNSAEDLFYTVPAGRTLYVTSFAFSTSDATKGIRFRNIMKYDQVDQRATGFFLTASELVSFNTTFYRELEIPTKIPEKTDIEVVAVSAQAGGVAFAALRGWTEAN